MAGTGDKKDNAGHTPSSPMPQNGHTLPAAISQLSLDTSGGTASPIPQLARAASDLNRKNSNSEWTSDAELPFKGKC